ASYERNLYRVFSHETRRQSRPNAAQFLRHHRDEISHIVARGTGVHHYTINHIVKHMIVRCREENLRVTIPEAEARQLILVTLTMQVMQVLRTGNNRITLLDSNPKRSYVSSSFFRKNSCRRSPSRTASKKKSNSGEQNTTSSQH